MQIIPISHNSNISKWIFSKLLFDIWELRNTSFKYVRFLKRIISWQLNMIIDYRILYENIVIRYFHKYEFLCTLGEILMRQNQRWNTWNWVLLCSLISWYYYMICMFINNPLHLIFCVYFNFILCNSGFNKCNKCSSFKRSQYRRISWILLLIISKFHHCNIFKWIGWKLWFCSSFRYIYIVDFQKIEHFSLIISWLFQKIIDYRILYENIVVRYSHKYKFLYSYRWKIIEENQRRNTWYWLLVCSLISWY